MIPKTENAELRRQLALQARRLVEETYDWDVLADRLERFTFEVKRHADDLQLAHAPAQNV